MKYVHKGVALKASGYVSKHLLMNLYSNLCMKLCGAGHVITDLE